MSFFPSTSQMQVDFDEINYMIYRYLLETGYHNTAYTFFHEASIDSLKIDINDVPLGLLVHIMHKALQMINIEMHIDQQGSLHHCNQPLSFLKPHSCNSAHILNQAIAREQIQIQQITVNGREMNCLDNLPKPILISPKEGMKVNEQADLDEQFQMMAKLQKEQENEIQKTIQNTGDKKFGKKIEPDIKLAQETSQLILSQLKLNEMLPQRNEIIQLQKQLQIHQQDDGIDADRIVEDKPKYQILTIFHQPTNVAITSIESTNIQSIQDSDNCKCTNLICSCLDTNTKPIQDVPIKFIGTSNGELYVYQLSSSQQDFTVSQDILRTSNKSKVVSIIIPNGQQRAIIVQQDGQVTIFRVNWDEKLVINKLYQHYPLGKFNILGAKINIKQQILSLYGNAPQPVLYHMRTKQIINQSSSDSFQEIQANDGMSMMYTLLKQDQTQKINNTQKCNVVDMVFFGHKGIIFIRDDGLIQINEVMTETDISYSVVYRNFIRQSTLCQLLTIDQAIYVITDGVSLYEFNTQQLYDIQPIEHKLDSPMKHVTVITNETIAYIHDKSNIFLSSGCVDGAIQIKNNWQLQSEIQDEHPIIFNSDGYCFVIDNVRHVIYSINISQEDVQMEQLAITDNITAVSADQKLSCVGSSSGTVMMCVVSET